MLKQIRESPWFAPFFDSKLDRARRLSLLTAIFDVGYGVLTFASGVIYKSWWSAAVGLYYGAMLVMALRLSLGIRKTTRMEPGVERAAEELRIYRDSAWALLLLNAMLTGVSFLIVNRGLSWTYPPFVIYGVAAFTFGYLAVAISGIVRGKPDDPYTEQAVSWVTLAKAIVGMFFLTTALIVEFGNDDMFRVLMESAVGTVCMPAVIVIAVRMLLKARREKRKLSSCLLCVDCDGERQRIGAQNVLSSVSPATIRDQYRYSDYS